MSVNSAGKLGAMQAATWPAVCSSWRTDAVELTACLACLAHTFTQLPQAMQRSATMPACPFSIRMALAGHSRTHV